MAVFESIIFRRNPKKASNTFLPSESQPGRHKQPRQPEGRRFQQRGRHGQQRHGQAALLRNPVTKSYRVCENSEKQDSGREAGQGEGPLVLQPGGGTEVYHHRLVRHEKKEQIDQSGASMKPRDFVGGNRRFGGGRSGHLKGFLGLEGVEIGLIRCLSCSVFGSSRKF